MNGARGQASTEYLVVLALCVVGLGVAVLGPAPFVELLQSIRDFFAAYSYAISVTP